MSKKLVLITGGASGIGCVAAQHFLSTGYNVLVCDRDESLLHKFKLANPEIHSVFCDVSSEKDVLRLSDYVAETWGKLDCLISNVGIPGPTKEIQDVTLEEWNETFASNVTGHFLLAKEFKKLLLSGVHPCMLLTASVAGKLGYPLRAPYAATKWATIGFAKTLAKEWGIVGIRVNAILPGIVNGPRMNNLIISRSAARKKSQSDIRKDLMNLSMSGRMIEMHEIASVMVFLCSDQALAITGQDISVCGGLESLSV
jgi:NAD(P)-dependent dehydrogenase (short-subunit alcohol dehydrogenase family)